MIDPGTRFWLRHVEDSGGLWEPAGDRVLVVLPSELAQRYRLPEELTVTGDPDVAREDGATLLGAGHPVLTEAAESVIAGGDAGCLLLEPGRARPPDEVLLDHARSQLPISHGKIDRTGPSRPVTRWVLRVGVLASYAISAEEVFQEQVERWVDVADRRELPGPVVDRLVRAPITDKDHSAATPAAELAAAVAEAHRLIEADALRRRTVLSTQLDGAHDRERERAVAYYADAIAGIERRLATIAPDRRPQLADRLTATQQERARRLAEIAEKHQARHELQPYRLHLIGVPAIRLPVDVRRGDRRYSLLLDWLAPSGTYANPRCPACDSTAPLVAGKRALGCLACLTPAAPPAPAPTPTNREPGKRTETPAASAAGHQANPKPPAPAPAPAPVAHEQPVTPAAPSSKPSPSPAPAKGRRPGGQRSATGRALAGAGSRPPAQAEKIAAAVWNAVADRRARRLRDVITPGSPAAALCRLYGADGPAIAVGIHPDELRSFSSGSEWLTAESGYTAGVLMTGRERHPYALHWRTQGRGLSVMEVLSYPPHQDLRLLGLGRRFLGSRRTAPAPIHATGLDDVAKLLASVGVPWQGVSVAARALAAWWRVSDELPALDQPAVVAAAIHRLVAGRAAQPVPFRQAAEAYQADEAAVRRADAALRRRLDLGASRAW